MVGNLTNLKQRHAGQCGMFQKFCQDIFRIFSIQFLLLHDDGGGRWHHTVDDVLQNVPEKKNHFIIYGGSFEKQNHCGGFIQ